MHGRPFFGFEVTKLVPLQKEVKGSRVHVRATLGAKIFAGFHIDVLVGTAKSGEPDELPAAAVAYRRSRARVIGYSPTALAVLVVILCTARG